MANTSTTIRKSVNLLPTYFQTNVNSKFLASTIDPLISVPELVRISGFVGSKLDVTYNSLTDVYISDSNSSNATSLRQKYQLQPALTMSDVDQNITKAYGFDDLVNQLGVYGANTKNFNKLFSPEVNAYDPHIDWDKFANFNQYYWLPVGPDPISISGQQQNTISTYAVTDSPDGHYFIFSPDGVTEDPLTTLYKGVTYVFNVNSQNTFYIKANNQSGDYAALTSQDGVINNGTSTGQIIFTVGDTLPGTLFYGSSNNDVVVGTFLIRPIQDNSSIDVDQDIVGKVTYKTANGIQFINGLKIQFVGNVTPSSYLNKTFIVEGVGKSITLVDFSTLVTPEMVGTIFDENFDATNFDDYPFDGNKTLPLTPDYITINRASRDLNPWTRYNRWFHADVITTTALANGNIPVLPSTGRAQRPIIEFEPNIQLYNFGTNAIIPVDIIDQTSADVFSTIEGSTGYTVDGVALTSGQRIIFLADTDSLVYGNVFEVTFVSINGQYVINLVETYSPVTGDGVSITQGDIGQGTQWWFNGSQWNSAQARSKLNSPPLFDLFDGSGNSFSDKTYYDSIFYGNQIFGYSIGKGADDLILGFPLNYYQNIGIEGSYLFENYFNNGSLSLLNGNQITTIQTSQTFLRVNQGSAGYSYENVWTAGAPYQLAVQQFQVAPAGTSTIPVTVFDNSSLITDLKISIFLDTIKLNTDAYTLTTASNGLSLNVNFVNTLTTVTNVLFNCYTSSNPNEKGTYEVPLNLTNNPLNGQIEQFTLSELSNHVQTMTQNDPDFLGLFPGESNLKSLPTANRYGTRLISNNNPLSFAQIFLTDIEHSLINATRAAASDYYQFKLNLLKLISQSDQFVTPGGILDQAIGLLIKNKNYTFPYSLSDMIPYGDNYVSKSYTVKDIRNIKYPLPSVFDITKLSNRAVLIYQNGNLLTYGIDYIFDPDNPSVTIIASLKKGDTINIVDYVSTVGSYVPPTPTKLGLYPSYAPLMYLDSSYVNGPVVVIQGHDGSLTVAYTKVADYNNKNIDFRDLALLEYEKRVFNNLKTQYDPDLLNINTVLPGVFRNNDYSYNEIYKLIEGDFINWTSAYNINFIDNAAYNPDYSKTYNFKSATDYIFNSVIPGNWRGMYKYYFDTERPDTCPWEMLGFTIKPIWWETEYGPGPYTSGNLNLWQDLEAGLIRQGNRAGVDMTYVRPGLSKIIPVDASGNTVDIRQWASLGQNGYINNPDQDWAFGDNGPAENAWRRSSLWPFAVQIACALAKPADYAAKMFDPSRLRKDVTGQYKYGPNSLFLSPSNVSLFTDVDSSGNTILSAGYSVWVIEHGKKRSATYLLSLKQDLSFLDFNLFYKIGGFTDKNQLEIVIDSVSPNTVAPGVLFPGNDYTLFFNVSNPIRSVSISGIIIEKKNGQFLIKGYDKQNPFFTINAPIHQTNDTIVSVGGKSPPFLNWAENTLYIAGQYIKYNNTFYTVSNTINSGTAFNPTDYIKLSQLPTIGGATVLGTFNYSFNDTIIPYGTYFSTLQEVYDLIVGYGQYLVRQGFVFNEYNSNLGVTLDWFFSGKEFLYWTTQNWADGSVITVSPFADKIQYKFTNAAVDSVLDSFYNYSLLNASGNAFPYQNIGVSREDGICSISTVNTTDGLYFARLNLVQKEHTIVMKNKSMFGDIVYDIETGYRQARILLSGFVTGKWNGNYLSPGFVYDDVSVSNWKAYIDYRVSDVVKYNGQFYSANQNITGSSTFVLTQWDVLGSAPVAQLLPNFEYQINQFQDFYSLDVNNFNATQQQLAQHLTGYTPRQYLTNIFIDPVAQYKFYQGFIREKGTYNSIEKLAKASIHNLQGQIKYDEEWAFRVGSYGNYLSYDQLEFPLDEANFVENSQIIQFVDTVPVVPFDPISYITPAQVSIKPNNYSSNNVFATINSSTYTNTNFVLPVAGYVRTDDVTATAYNIGSLLDIANNNLLNDGNTIWIGFTSNSDWDVFRYTKQMAKVIGTQISIPATSLLFITDSFHNLVVGDIVSIRGLDNGTDGVYKVLGIPSPTSFTISSTLVQVQTPTVSALLYKFISVRINSFDDVSLLQQYVDFKDGDKVWADRGDASTPWAGWEVYQKTYNYSTASDISVGGVAIGQQFAYQMATRYNNNTLVISAPSYYGTAGANGNIYVLDISNINQPITVANFSLYPTSTNPNLETALGLGASLAYDAEHDIVLAGAPNQSIVQFTGINRSINANTSTVQLFDLTSKSGFGRFGSTIFLAENGDQFGNKILLVASPDEQGGPIYVYGFNAANNTATFAYTFTPLNVFPYHTRDYVIAGNSNGSTIAVATLDHTSGNNGVGIYNSVTGFQYATQILDSVSGGFGSAMAMSSDGMYLVVSAPYNNNGMVLVYKLQNHQYTKVQEILNPSMDKNLYFGTAITIDNSANKLIISSSGKQKFQLTFDKNGTTFDNTSLTFYDYIENSGVVSIYERKNINFVFSTELKINIDAVNSLGAGNNFGKSLAINSNNIFVGAPGINAYSSVGNVYAFTELNPPSLGWKTLRQQDSLVDVSKINRAITIDTTIDQVQNYLDVIDPIKGRIAGIAEQELTYKTLYDPAVYSVGTQQVVVDTNTSWIEDHVGELWWDLSTVKYIWYEQSDLEYRKNSWGKIFPGASVDVYEWVTSSYLPSQWSALADTPDGLAKGISGQPKYPDNSVVSVKQYYNGATGATSNIYYYWVKNTVVLPAQINRRLSANDVASAIFNPAGYGLEFVSILSPNALAVTNLISNLIGDTVNLNISQNLINNDIKRHTEWILLGEGVAADQPTTLLNKKLIDSLVGQDSLGNQIPDPLLSDRQKYGIEIRPRQSLFVDRKAALRNAIEYVNTVTSQYLITDMIDFTLLNSKQEIPAVYLNEYDQLVDVYDDLLEIKTSLFSPAILTCSISTGTGTVGTISSVNIINPGSYYGTLVPIYSSTGSILAYQGPTVQIYSSANSLDISGAVITTQVNAAGSIITATIVNPGNNFTVSPILAVRPFTIIVQNDVNSDNLWAKYQLINGTLNKTFTQSFDTTKYWNYVNWVSADYDPVKPLAATVAETYLLASLSLTLGDYVKVNNQGNGNYIILQYVARNGTFSDNFNLVCSENGTIRFSDDLWNSVNNEYNFDYHFTYDQTLYDQTPVTELINILNAIKNNIFIGELLVYWNYFFFKAVKYAMSEQLFLDWAFKTSFINVTNLAGSLDQRPVYKFQNSQYYQEYIQEVKPYHTKIRNYQVEYSVIDPSQTYTTDFDLPSFYNTLTQKFTVANPGDSILNSYPWKGWASNYTLSVDSIIVENPGSGYTSVPTVQIIPAMGDTGAGATAEASISLGKVVGITVTNGGSGYTSTPTVLVVGGGSTNLTLASAYPVMINKKVRNVTTEIKFDRVSGISEISTSSVTDVFYCDGNTLKFPLSWAAENKKSNISINVNGLRVLATEYNIVTYKQLTNGYQKLYSTLILNVAPPNAHILTITYNKNVDLYYAADRISAFYSPTPGMPANNIALLMSGVEFPGTQIQGLPFSYTTNWDEAPFGQTLYGDDSDYYITSGVAVTASSGTYQLQVNSIAGITPGLYVNTVALTTSTLNDNKFGINNVTVISVNTAASIVTFSTSTIETIIAGTVMLEFWDFNKTSGILDTVLDGGDLGYTTATGTGTADIIVDADKFISANVSNSPEELINGSVSDTLGISIFTRDNPGVPLVTQTFDQINQITSTSIFNLITLPPNTSSVLVSFNNRVLNYGNDYTINFNNQTLIINTQTTTGLVGITAISAGGNGYINFNYIEASNTNTISLSIGIPSEIGSLYVSLNGVTLTSSQYSLNSQGEIVVTGLDPASVNVLQAYAFLGSSYSVVHQQTHIFNGRDTAFAVLAYPGNTWSPNSQAIVEYNNSIILTPPNTVYYSINSNQTIFLIDPNNNYPSGAFSLGSLEVYVNGVQLRNGIDFILNQSADSIQFNNGFLHTGDVMAITNYSFSDYYFKYGGIDITNPAYHGYGSQIKVVTFTDATGSLIRTEVFKSHSSRQYKISRIALNQNYLWVTIGGYPLINGVDFYVGTDNQTIIIRDTYPFDGSQMVSIMSMANVTDTVSLGYRVFTDLLNKTQYKRLSQNNTTQLAQDLQITATNIVVQNISGLTPPNPALRTSGLILIEGELIQFNGISGNTLTGITRGSFGTGSKSIYYAGTTVLDQGYRQNLPYSESIVRQVLTATNTTSYSINGILLTTATSINQVSIYYGGQLLNKQGYYQQDASVCYDAITSNIIGTVSTSTLLPATTVLGTAYLVSGSNQVWTYTASKLASATTTNGYVYSGLMYVNPQFTITNVISNGTISTATLILNLPSITPGISISVVQRTAINNFYASTTTSLLNDTGIVAKILQLSPALLPDKYYYE